jgi:T4-like virus Myoviridae tail sheath stabiliser
MAVVQFSYDGQIRRFVTQFIRMLSNFQVEFGKDASGVRALQTIPVYYGDISRQAAMILRGNSENTLNAVPAMAVYISALTYDRDRLQNPYHESVISVRERTYNENTQTYGNAQDGIYTVERLMPAPYKLTMKCSVWTSNTEQKHQILEQLIPLFNPGFEIQNSDNYLDWTSLSVALLTEVQYTNRTVPAGSDESYDIAELTFELPIWITLPAKVKKMGVVTQIIANIYDQNGDFTAEDYTQGSLTTQRFTPLDCKVVFIGNTLTLYKKDAHMADGQIYGSKLRWLDVINFYGKITNGISQIRLLFPYPDGPHEIVGTVAYSPSDTTQLLYTPFAQTLPANTLPPVNAIIDPLNVTVDSNILTPATGTRYLILNSIGDPLSESPSAWGGSTGTLLIASANDIIEWNGSYWYVSFDSKTNEGVQYVTNLNTTIQYRWTGSNWVKAYEGLYGAGEWSLIL